MIAPTSRKAGKSVKGSATRKGHATIFKSLLRAGARGMTLEELSIDTGMKLQTCCARRNELGKKHFVIDSGTRRPTNSGRTATVWVIPKGVIVALKKRRGLVKGLA